MGEVSALTWRKRLLISIICLAGLPIVSLMLIEGGSSGLVFLHEILFGDDHPVADHLYTQYDPTLGWVTKSNVNVRDVYGHGNDVRTNAQGFRHDGHVPNQVPAGRLRIICSGNSFTFGFGVDNSETWSSLLTAQNPVFETVNLGVVGYGVDQMYLRFLRDATPLDYHVHVVAFIDHDFKRMGFKSLLGADKPILVVRDGDLVVDNTPVAKHWFTPHWWIRTLRATSQLRTAELFRRVGRSSTERSTQTDASIWQAARRAFDDLQRESKREKASLALVYLPSQPDLDFNNSAKWGQVVGDFALDRDIQYLDLSTDFVQLPADSVQTFFRPIDGHYTERGHRWIAERMHSFLKGVVGAKDMSSSKSE